MHITRRTPWWADEGEQITTHDWAAVVAADSDLEMVQVARVSPRGQDAVLEYRHAWLAHGPCSPRFVRLLALPSAAAV